MTKNDTNPSNSPHRSMYCWGRLHGTDELWGVEHPRESYTYLACWGWSYSSIFDCERTRKNTSWSANALLPSIERIWSLPGDSCISRTRRWTSGKLILLAHDRAVAINYSYDWLSSPHQWERLMSFSESFFPRCVRWYRTAHGVSPPIRRSMIPDCVSSSRRSVRIFVLASPMASPMVLKLWCPSPMACRIKITHFFPRREKRDWAFGQVHWGVLTIEDRLWIIGIEIWIRAYWFYFLKQNYLQFF